MTCQIERSTLSAGALEGRPPGCRRLPGPPSPPVKPMAAEQINDACTTADVPLINGPVDDSKESEWRPPSRRGPASQRVR